MNQTLSRTAGVFGSMQRFWLVVGYVVVVLIWGTTWIALGTQVENTSVHISVALRTGCASLIFFGCLAALRLPWRLRRDQLRAVLVQGVCFYGTNFIAVYSASQYLTSGVLAVVFSITVPFNLVVGWLVEQRRPTLATLVAALMGITGIGLVFGTELAHTTLSSSVYWGAGLAVFGAATVAVGNVLLAGAAASEIGMLRVNAYGFGVGTAAILLWGLVSGSPWTLAVTPSWIAGFAYLLLIGSVLALAIYIKILPQIGYVAGAYVVVLAPVIALAISSVFEHLTIGPLTIAGVVLLLAGHSILILRGRR